MCPKQIHTKIEFSERTNRNIHFSITYFQNCSNDDKTSIGNDTQKVFLFLLGNLHAMLKCKILVEEVKIICLRDLWEFLYMYQYDLRSHHL